MSTDIQIDEQILSQPVTDDARTEARLCAIQAVYQWRLVEESPSQIISQFKQGPVKSRKANVKLFELVCGAVQMEGERLTTVISSNLKEGWTFDRLDNTLQALLLVAAAEISAQPDTPYKVLMNEYVALARAFFDKEVGFVNGLLDKLARIIRPEEFAE